MGGRSRSQKDRRAEGQKARAERKPRRLSFSVREELAARIASGRLAHGQRLPPEPQLAEELGVSRPTLREALRSLEDDGFLTRRRGAGTYVTSRLRLRNNLDVNFGVTAAITTSGMRPGTARAEVRPEEADDPTAEALGIEPGDQVLVLERVRTADGKPVVFSRDVAAVSVVGEDAFASLDEGSIYDLIQSRSGRGVHQGVVTIEPAKANRRLARALDVATGTLLLYLRQVDYDREGTPLLLSHEHHVADAFEFSVVRRGPGRRNR